MKGWKETYTNIVLDEKLGRKTVRLVKDLEKAIDKTGDLIKQLPEELEVINGDYSESYGELNSGQNSLEYGIRHLEGDLKSLDSLSGVDEEIVNERLKYHSKSPAELKGSEFDRKQEIKNIKKMLKMIEKAHDFHSKFQYNNRAAGDPAKITDGLFSAESALYDYMIDVEDGKWDGKVDLED